MFYHTDALQVFLALRKKKTDNIFPHVSLKCVIQGEQRRAWIVMGSVEHHNSHIQNFQVFPLCASRIFFFFFNVIALR